MAVDKHDLFEKTKAYWPEIIDLSENDAISIVYSDNNIKIPVDDKWRQFALWAFYQGLWELEQEAATDGLSTISPHSLEYSTFDKWMRLRLEGENDWAEGRIEWGT